MRTYSNIKIRLIIVLLAFFCVSLAFSLLVIKDFSHPLAGRAGIGPDPWINHDCVDMYEYVGFYFAKNLSFLPIPQINLFNNQDFYPYGVSKAFQLWGIERDIYYAILYSFFGVGPWLQSYYLLTLITTAIGTFVLLYRDYGFVRASGAGFIVSFFNFYAIHKYPHHLNIAIVHWTTLSFIADFLIVKRVVLRQPVSLRLLLVRGCLLILSLGQELGYIAGFSLMSFTVSILFISVLLGYRYFRRELRLTELFQSKLETYKNEWLTYSPTLSVLLILSIICCYIYLPLVFQITREAKTFDFTGVVTGYFWANPVRLLIPFFPFINPGLAFEKIFLDTPEALGAGSPGWFLLILGAVGLWQSRKRATIFIPLLIIFLLCLLYHPFFFPTLKVFPWFTFYRAGGRSTVIYPVILCLFALEVNLNDLPLSRKRLISVFLVGLSCIELYTAYSFKLDYKPYSLNKNFFTYMDYIKKQPGEAVLDWPFCIAGGNGPSLCPYHLLNSGIYAQRRFHGKKVIGQYLGRLHPSQAEPYFQAGWDKLLLPNNQGTRQKRCFRSEEWSFFTDFYKLNDFAGINLYVAQLPEDCISQFYERFGTYTAETVVPSAGRVKFIPKSPKLRNQVNSTLGVSLKFEPLLDLSESNLLQIISPYGLTVTGLGEIEKDNQNSNFRWGMRYGTPETVLSFKLSKPQLLKLTFRFDTSWVGQDVAVEINKVAVETINNIKAGEIIEREFKFQGIVGLNNIVFKYPKNKSRLDILKEIIKSEGIKGLNWNNWNKNKVQRKNSHKLIKFRELAISAAE